jgi:hypothetical protein
MLMTLNSLRWPPLKDAIKYMLNQTFDQWPSSKKTILHPAASLLNPASPVDESSISVTSINGTTQGNDSDSTLGKESFATNGSLHEDVHPSTSPNTATAALALSSRFQREGDAEISIRDADLQAFFPSKRRAPAEWNGSWGRRLNSAEEVDAERRTIFSMLEEFEGQPPFTIQRLSELVLRPTEHHHTLPKYISALKRLLSVTATRDAFPDNVGQGELSWMTKMIKPVPEGEAGEGKGDEGEWMSSRENGMFNNNYRFGSGTTVPGSPATAPLFSPIPFLMRSGGEGMPGKGGSDDGIMEDGDVPGMELGGADRTSEDAVELAKRIGAGAGIGLSSGRVSSESNGILPSESPDRPVPLVRPAQEAEPATTALPSASSSVENSNVTNAGNGPRSNAPLGIPSGMVDELDQLGQKHGQLPPVESGTLAGGAKALTSTTTSTAAAAAASEEQGEIRDVEGERAIKRVRSERNLPDLEQEEAK